MSAAVNQEAHSSRRAAVLEATEAVFAERGCDLQDEAALHTAVLASMGQPLAGRPDHPPEGGGSPGERNVPADGLRVLSAVLGASTLLTRRGGLLGSVRSELPLASLAERDEHRALPIAMFHQFFRTRPDASHRSIDTGQEVEAP